MFTTGMALLVGSGIVAFGRDPSGTEVAVFRALNDGPEVLRRPNWALMLGGTLGAVPAASAVALVARRRRLAVHLAVGGTSAYVLAKVVKPYVGRPRPGSLLEDVTFRDEIGGNQGWISGHAAVSSTLALTAGPSMPAAARVGAYAWSAIVGAGRMYAGAHMPLDVAGGYGLGLMIAALAEPRTKD
jgi:membrane-associated phospholipid phosphatase